MSTMTTPTTVNDISDVARILREHPEWLDVIRSIVLGEELLNLPQQLSDLAQRVDEFVRATNDNFRLVNERLDKLETGQSELREGQSELREGQSELREGQSELREGQSKLREGQSKLWASQSELREGQSKLWEGQLELREGQSELRESLSKLWENQSDLRANFARLEGRFSNFEGTEYERRVRNRLISRSTHRFDLNRPVIVMTQDAQSAPQFNSVMHRALRSGLLTMPEFEDVHEADIVIRDEDDRYLLAEVSITAENDDVERAVRRSRLLATAADTIVIPALVAAIVAEPQRALADAQGVSLFVISYP